MAEQLDFDVDHCLGHLKDSFEMQAEWRREKAAEFPDDAKRNMDAAEVFDKLAATVKDVTAETGALYAHACNGKGNRYHAVIEIERDLMASIHISYDSAEEFVRKVAEEVIDKNPDEDVQH